MKMHDECLPCLINQVIKVAHMTNANDKTHLYQKVFHYLSKQDFQKTNPEIIGETFRLLKEHIDNQDPYYQLRHDYNQLFLAQQDQFRQLMNQSSDVFLESIKYAIIGNIIDFNPIHNHNIDDMMESFRDVHEKHLEINHTLYLREDIMKAKTLLYLGDNCGEICLDYLLIEKIKDINPELDIYFGVRGAPVVNDSIVADAYEVGMDRYATIISNGDDSLGTVLSRTSAEFLEVYHRADVIMSKGQANYESLSEDIDKNIYFMLMVKCSVIAMEIGVKEKSLICFHQRYRRE